MVLFGDYWINGLNKLIVAVKKKIAYLLHASIVMLKHSATKKTALTRAPNTSALAHPNVFLDHFFGDIYFKLNKQIYQ